MNLIQEYLQDPGCHPPPEVNRFLNGDCHLFAIAVHRLTGWQIVAYTEPRYEFPGGVKPLEAYAESLLLPKNELLPYAIRPGLVHAVCCAEHYGNTHIFDAKGWRDSQLLQKEYGFHSDCQLGFYSPQELYNIVHHDQVIDQVKIKEVIDFVHRYYVPLFKKAGE